jgi:FemAB-related protein (PEP-CTERM system-associated)
MIETHHSPDTVLVSEVLSFLEESEEANGHYGECSPGWLNVLQRGLGHEPFVLVSRDARGAVDGYLPLALVASRLFGRFLVSLPYVTHAGIVASDHRVAAELRDRAVALADRLDVDHLEIRSDAPLRDERFTESRSDKVRMTRPLPRDREDLWQDVGPKVRNQVRKGARQGFTLRFGRHELVDGFYDVLSENMRDLGSPVHPRRFFSELLDAFPARAEIAVAADGGRAVAAAVLVHGVRGRLPGTATTVPAASCRRSVRPTSANMWLYHRLMLRAAEQGSAEFDFGRSSMDSGPYRFKRQWGARPLPTCWESYVRRGDVTALRPDDRRHAARIAAWKRLPVWLTRIVGPRVVRGIP